MPADGDPPLLALRHFFWVAKVAVDAFPSRVRRAAFIVRLRLLAVWQRGTIQVEVAPDVRFEREVRATIAPRSRNVLRIGPKCSLGARTLFALSGGEVIVGDWVDLKRDAVVSVAGTLFIEGENLVQRGVSIHCDESVTIRRKTTVSERTTIVDSAHFFSTPERLAVDNVKTGPVVIGYNCWIGANATIGRNVTVGDFAIVAANSLVVTDVPSGHLASGVPAQTVRPVHLPWRDDRNSANSS